MHGQTRCSPLHTSFQQITPTPIKENSCSGHSISLSINLPTNQPTNPQLKQASKQPSNQPRPGPTLTARVPDSTARWNLHSRSPESALTHPPPWPPPSQPSYTPPGPSPYLPRLPAARQIHPQSRCCRHLDARRKLDWAAQWGPRTLRKWPPGTVNWT